MWFKNDDIMEQPFLVHNFFLVHLRTDQNLAPIPPSHEVSGSFISVGDLENVKNRIFLGALTTKDTFVYVSYLLKSLFYSCQKLCS